jgi:MEMO1 family protein
MKFLRILIPLCLLLAFSTTILNAQYTRPIKDTVGFAWSSIDMDRLMGYLNRNAEKGSFTSAGLIGGLSPHDDYLYAGKVYYPLYRNIQAREFVIIGVTHGTVRKAINDQQDVIIFDSYDLWNGPYKTIKTSPLREELKKNLDPRYFSVNDEGQTLEHSIEALLPFIQHYNREIKITSIMVTAMDLDRMETISGEISKIIANYVEKNNMQLGTDIFFLISSDANHYGKDFNNTPYGEDEKAHKTATDNDKRIAETCLGTEINNSSIKKLTDELWVNKPTPVWCGRYAIPFGLLTISKVARLVSDKGVEGKVFKYSDTVTEGVLPVKNTKMGLTAVANYQHWCGWLSAGFYLK